MDGRELLLGMHRAPDWDHTHGSFGVAQLAKIFKPQRIAEIGVCMGHTAAEVAYNHLFEKYYLIDWWKDESPYMGYNNKYEFVCDNFGSDDFEIIKAESSEAVKHIEDDSLDLVYIDAGHTYEKTSQDISDVKPKVKVGGVIAGDGFGWKNPCGVQKAVFKHFDKRKVFRNCGPDYLWWTIKEQA